MSNEVIEKVERLREREGMRKMRRERGSTRQVIAPNYHNAWLSRLIGSAYADRQIIINHIARGLPFMRIHSYGICTLLYVTRPCFNRHEFPNRSLISRLLALQFNQILVKC